MQEPEPVTVTLTIKPGNRTNFSALHDVLKLDGGTVVAFPPENSDRDSIALMLFASSARSSLKSKYPDAAVMVERIEIDGRGAIRVEITTP